MVALFIREPFAVGLENSVSTFPQLGAQRVERVTALFELVSLQVLEGINGFHGGQKLMEPCHTAFRLAVLCLLDEFGNFILAERTIRDGSALDYRNLNVINAGEKQAFPLILRSLFESQLEIRVLGPNEL